MTSTQETIASIERLLERRQAVPSNLIRSLVAICKNLLTITTQQSKEIAALKAAAKAEEGQPS